ncbi:MAG: polysaccharide biosynthesis tyrosine autokinase [Bradymonadaceae bacterium]|nr:polysaccharide biosynthesis tyrosine autokinase [Lujinxingiaceae bacterium]
MSDAFGFQEPRGSGAADDEGESLGRLISRYWGLLKKFYWILIVTSILCVAAAYFWTDQQPRIYQATSKLIFHEAKPNIFGKQIERVELIDPGGRWQFEQFWNTQREVLRSKWFAERVVKREGLIDDPRFMPAPPEGVTRSPEDTMRIAVGKVLGVSEVSLQRDSRVGLIRVQIDNAEMAAKISDGISQTYVEYIREFQSSGVGQLATWFDTYVSTKRNELDVSRTELQEYQRDNNILSLSFEERQLLNNTELQAVSGQLREVRATMFAEAALLNQIVTMEKGGADLRALADLVANDSLRRALGREAELKEEIARLRPRYLDSHPDVESAHERLIVVRSNISDEINRIRTSVENRVAVTRQNEANLQNELVRIKQDVAQLNDIGVQYSLLRASTEDLKQHYDMVLNRSNELDINTLYESDIIQVLENADIPRSPISPKLPLNLAVGLMLGLAVGGGIMVLIDALDNTVKSDEHVSKYTSRPILGMLPAVDASAVKSLEKFGESALDTLTHTAPRSSFAEGIKSLRANLMFMAPDNPPKLLLMTSPGPSEGKTLTSVNMGIALSQSGLRTLIVDSDLRRPRVHKALGVVNDVGLSSIMTGDSTLSEAVKETGIENFSILTCGPIPPNPSELLQSEKFRALVEEMKGSYDRIIFDSPPLAAVADALVLSHSVDAVLLILKFGQTRQELLRRSVEQLEAIGAPFMGCVLNDIRDSVGYGYAYYYRYRYDEPDEVKKPDKKRGPKLAS